MKKYYFPLSPWNQQRQYEKLVWVYPAHIAMYATYLRNKGLEVIWGGNPPELGKDDIVITNDEQIDVSFEDLPFPDRDFTDGKNPRWQEYGNYKYHPATHMMASNLCWYGKCTFCIDTLKLNSGEKRGLRKVSHVIEEIDDLIKNGYKEVFDDSGTFPVGQWLDEFCAEMNKEGRNKKIKIGCNMKPVKLDYKMMKQAGFRFILVGFESANQNTLDIIQKGQREESSIRYIKDMSEAGLDVHLTSMFGYEHEAHKDAMRTVKTIHYLLKKGIVKTAQASVYSPPRTKPSPGSRGHLYVPMIYDVYKSPEFIFRKIINIRDKEDALYLLRGARLVIEEKVRKIWAK